MHLLPDVADYLAAQSKLIRPAARHDALRRRKYCDAQATAHPWNAISLGIHSQTRLADALQLGEDGALVDVAQGDTNGARRVFTHHIKVTNVTLRVQDAIN